MIVWRARTTSVCVFSLKSLLDSMNQLIIININSSGMEEGRILFSLLVCCYFLLVLFLVYFFLSPFLFARIFYSWQSALKVWLCRHNYLIIPFFRRLFSLSGSLKNCMLGCLFASLHASFEAQEFWILNAAAAALSLFLLKPSSVYPKSSFWTS